LFKSGTRGVKNQVKKFIDAKPKKVVEKLAVINKTTDDIIRNEFRPVDLAPEKVGFDTHGVIEKDFKALGKEVGVFKDEAARAAGNTKFKPILAEENTFRFFDEHNIHIDPQTGKASLSGNEVFDIGVSKEVAQEIVDFNNTMVDRTSANGGLSIQELFNSANNLGRKAEQMADGSTGVRDPNGARLLQNLSNAIAGDKNEAINQALKGTDLQDAAAESIGKYRDTVGKVRELRKLWSKTEDGELFVDAVFRKGNTKKVRDIKALLGEDSADWKQLKASFMLNKMEESTDVTTGVFRAKKFVEGISNLGSEVRRELISEGDFNKIRSLAIDYEKLGVAEVFNDPKSQGTLLNLMVALTPVSMFPQARARAALNLARGNANASDYLLDRGFVELAENATSKSDKKSWMKSRSLLRDIVTNSRRVTKQDGSEVIVNTPIARNLIRTTLLNGLKPEPSLETEAPVEGELSIDQILRGE
jgi:hypothetical protein